MPVRPRRSPDHATQVVVLVTVLVVAVPVVASVPASPSSAPATATDRAVDVDPPATPGPGHSPPAVGDASTVGTATRPAPTDRPVVAPSRTRPDGPGVVGESSPDDSARPPRVLAAYPNPARDGDSGEFVVLAVPARHSPVVLTDGETNVTVRVGGVVVVSPEPAAARNLTRYLPALAGGADGAGAGGSDADDGGSDVGPRAPNVTFLRADLALSNAGERLRLFGTEDGATLDAVEYGEAPEGEVRYWTETPSGGGDSAAGTATTPGDGADGRWRPLGATDRPVVSAPADRARVYALPDAPGAVLDALRSADRRILLAAYTFRSRRVARVLRRAAGRGVTVRVLVEGSPVGGFSRESARLLDGLVAAGVDVVVLGARSPYDFHHAKYAVVDDRAIVTTENWKPAGVGGRSSRGWGVTVRGPAVAAELADLFRTDARTRGARDWRSFRSDAEFASTPRARGDYPAQFDPATVPVESVDVLVAPENAERALAALVRDADRSVRIEQVTVDRGPLLRAAVAAARRGAEVRILLSGAWYVAEDNRRIAEVINARADREDLAIEVRIADPGGRFEKIHAKGVVVDGDAAAVGSLNWNRHGARRNRELVVVLHGEGPAGYFARVFDADWRGGRRRLPVGPLAALAVLVAVALLVARARVEFDDVPVVGDGPVLGAGGDAAVPSAGSDPDPDRDPDPDPRPARDRTADRRGSSRPPAAALDRGGDPDGEVEWAARRATDADRPPPTRRRPEGHVPARPPEDRSGDDRRSGSG